MQARWAKHCNSRPVRRAVPGCYQQQRLKVRLQASALRVDFLSAGVLGEGGQGAAWDPCGAETAAAPVQGPPLPACCKGHVSATLLIRQHSRSVAPRLATADFRRLRTSGSIEWQQLDAKPERRHCSIRRTCCCEILRVPMRGHQIHTPQFKVPAGALYAPCVSKVPCNCIHLSAQQDGPSVAVSQHCSSPSM